MKELHPIKWPEGLPRTSLGEREDRRQWKKTYKQACTVLDDELRKFKCFAPVLTLQSPDDFSRAPDPSICVYFSRQRAEDFSWQKALGINNPAPSIEEINTAFKRLAAKYHTDRGGDLEIYLALDKHKNNAIAYAKRFNGYQSDYCIPCDKFNETAWNVMAVCNTVRSFRQMERDGTSFLVERSLEGFKAQLTAGAPVQP